MKDIFVKDGVLYLPHARGGFIKWPVDMIGEFEYFWRNVPERGVDNSRKAEVFLTIANARVKK